MLREGVWHTGRRLAVVLLLGIMAFLLGACSQEPEITVAYDPQSLKFSGDVALADLTAFVTRFPYRHSGQPNNVAAAGWLAERFTAFGYDCAIDRWPATLYDEEVQLNNVVCSLPGNSTREIVLMAHHDQSPATVQGADNDGSGIAILLQLAEILAAEQPLPYTLTFVATDGEEYGMLGARRFVETHPETGRVIAGITLDNVGKAIYNDLEMSPIGQFRRYGPLWLQLAAHSSAVAAGNVWIPDVRSPVDQVLNQAVPISFMDQGPLVAAGIPAFGFAGLYPPERAQDHWDTYHVPEDTVDAQSAETLRNSGTVAESTVRQLMGMSSFPVEGGPYLYLGESGVVRSPVLWLLFAAFAGLIFAGAALVGGPISRAKLRGWRAALPNFLGWWLPMLGAVLVLYLLELVGVIPGFELYPALARDPLIFNPIWSAVIISLIALLGFFVLGRRLARRYAPTEAPTFGQKKSLALLVTGLMALYMLALNPFSLLFLVPVLFWFLTRGRSKVADVTLFFAGGLIIYVLIYFFGFVILKNDFAILWYLMLMITYGTVSFFTVAGAFAVVSAGVSMLTGAVQPQTKRAPVVAPRPVPGD